MLILKFIIQSYVLSIAVKSLMYKFVSKVKNIICSVLFFIVFHKNNIESNKTQYFRLRLYDSDFNALDCSLT